MVQRTHLIGCIFVLAELILSVNLMNINSIDKTAASLDLRYASSIKIDDVMGHLNALQQIANNANGNRAAKTIGFNRTLDYITDYLTTNTNLAVSRSFFNLRTCQLLRNPTLSSSINGVVKTYTYSSILSIAEFYHVQCSISASITNDLPLTVIPHMGCSDADWLAARPLAAGIVAIVKRGNCTFETKAILASKYNVAALLIYNDGASSSNMQPANINLGQNNRIPALSLSYNIGQSLVDAANDPSKLTRIRLTISADTVFNPTGNVCADTLSGDPTQTIIIGSHSDSVPAGPGINDNGSGTAANLVLATMLSKLLQTETYEAYRYRVRFCWWGAEELGLLGSNYHVTEAKKSTVIGERIGDYLVNINLDMLGSPNFIFGIYDGKTASATTPAVAKPGSNKMTELFQSWFVENGLPWDYTKFDGRSDYGPFLAAGVAAGGLFSGADASKTVEQYNRYRAILGASLAGTASTRQDICYHQSCDKTTNINVFALEKMVKASAHAIESLGRQSDLKTWLYPVREIQEIMNKQSSTQQTYEYNSVNEYFQLPYY